ncbi:TonB-dependent receptor [Paraburkholderia acidipaludis]|uniref:TonB-dependent receptor n=1 Tax=Paraburkholderia acidipaludis TaxID=660537 RepID=UPI0004802C5F|nr:TonB-dependent receptor [Paraburkholderia acidipaludis]
MRRDESRIEKTQKMKRSLLTTSVALMLPAQLAFADSSGAPAVLPQIVVSASRDEATLAEMPQSTTIITRQQIDNSPAQSLDQLLRNVAGINLSTVPATSKDPTGQSLGMRGLGNSTVLVLLDGVPIMDPFYGTVQWFKVPLDNIDRIEIVRGGSVVWGNMAVGGVINILTRKPTDNRTTVSASYGSFGTKNVSLNQNLKVNDALAFNFSVSQLDSPGYQLTPSAYLWRFPDKGPIWTRDTNAQLTAYLHPSADLQGYLRFGYHVNNEEISYQYGQNKQTSPDFAASLTKTLDKQSSVTATAWAQEVSFDKYNGATCYWKPAGGCLSLSSTLTGLPASAADDPVDQYYTQYGDQSYHESGFSTTYSRTIGKIWRDIQVGADYRRLSASDSESIYNTPTVYGLPTGSLAASVSGSGVQSYGGLFLQTRIAPIESLLITLAGRLDRFSSDIASTEGGNPQLGGGTTKTRFDPSVSARYFINDDLSLRASVNETFRGPGLNNSLRSYGSASSTPSIADPSLVPQDMLEREIGLDYDRGGLDLSATYFFYTIHNTILSTTSPASGAPSAYQQQLCEDFLAGSESTSCNFYSNAGNERSQGLELIGSYKISPRLSFNGSFTFTDAVLTSTSTNTPTGVQITGIPRLVGNFGVTWSPLSKLTLEAQAHYIGRMNYYSSVTAGTYSQGSNTVFDIGCSYQITPAIDLTLAVNNLFNRTYTDNTWTYNEPYTQTLSPPRMAFVGMQASF